MNSSKLMNLMESTDTDEPELIERSEQLATLKCLIGGPKAGGAALVLVFGNSGVGKSTLVEQAARELEVALVMISCVASCNNQPLLLHQLGATINAVTLATDTVATPPDSLNDLVRLLRGTFARRPEKLCLAFDQAERLRTVGPNLTFVLSRLQEYVANPLLSVVLVSTLPWEKFLTDSCYAWPEIVYVPEFTKDALRQILLADRASWHERQFSDELYAQFVDVMLDVFYATTCNLPELRHVAAMNFGHFVAPVESGTVGERDVRGLWKNVRPRLERALRSVYLRSDESDNRRQNSVVLPLAASQLLLAAFLASSNLQRLDRRLYLKNAGRIRKAVKQKSTNQLQRLKGPRAFSLERLLAIYRSISEDRCYHSVLLYEQLNNLVHMNLIAKVSLDILDSCKYKCLADLPLAQSLATVVDFDLDSYLHTLLSTMSDNGAIADKGSIMPPSESLAKLEQILNDFYDVRSTNIKPLTGYDDRNYQVVALDGRRFVLKIFNKQLSAEPGLVVAELQMLSHISSKAESKINCPRPVRNKDGSLWTKIELSDGRSYLCRLTDFIDGITLHSIIPSDALYYKIGAYMATLDILLEDFQNEEYSRRQEFMWSMLNIRLTKPHVHLVPDEQRRHMVFGAIERFEREVLDQRHLLSNGQIHGDFNEQNILISRATNADSAESAEWDVCGILDFGDACFSSYIIELGTLLTYVMFDRSRVTEDAAALLGSAASACSGYLATKPLPTCELRLLPLVCRARFCQSLALGLFAHSLNPTNDYVLTTSRSWPVLKLLCDLPDDVLLQRLTTVL